MSIKSGIYIIYYGKEYRIARIENHYKIIPNDGKDLNKDSIEYKLEKNLDPRIFFRMVPPPEIGDVYEISTSCLYHGSEFHTIYDDGKNYVLISNYSLLVKKFNSIRIDELGYEKAIPKDVVDSVYEKKELIADFFD